MIRDDNGIVAVTGLVWGRKWRKWRKGARRREGGSGER